MFPLLNPIASKKREAQFKKHTWMVIIFSLVYLLTATFLIGFKLEQIVLIGLVNGLYFFSSRTRKFIKGFSIFILLWVLFDFMKALPNYWFKPVNIEELYKIEKYIFGINFQGKLVTPNEYWLAHANTWLDVLFGIFYLTWIPLPLGFATYLFIRDKTQFLFFSLTFFLVNLIGFVIYYAYPAAPPWYVQQYGFTFIPDIPSSTAGLARFDSFFNIGIFKGIYTRSSNVFTALPALHSAYPVLVLLFGLKYKMGTINIFFAVIMVGIWFSTVYTSHHYIIDLFWGAICAVGGFDLFQGLMRQEGKAFRIVKNMADAIH